MRMLRWMCDNTLKERVRDECIHEKLEVAQIEDKTRKKIDLGGLDVRNATK